MNAVLSQRVFTLLYPAFLLLISYLIMGYSYQTSDEVIYELTFRGLMFYDQPEEFLGFFIGYYNLFLTLYKAYPELPWYGIVAFFLVYLMSVAVLSILFSLSPKAEKRNIILGIFTLVFFLILYESVYLLNITRLSILLSGIGIIQFALAVKSFNNNKANNLLSAFYALLIFLLGFLLRPGSGAFAMILVIPFVFFINYQPSHLFKLKFSTIKNALINFGRQLGLFIGIILLFQLAYNTRSSKPSPNYTLYQDLVDPFINLVDYDIYDKTYSFSAKEALEFEAIKNWYTLDPIYFNKATFDKWGKSSKFSVENLEPFKIFWNTYKIARYAFIDYLAITGIILLLLLLLFQNNRVSFGLSILYGVYFFLGIWVIAIFLKLPYKLFNPSFALFSLALLSYYFIAVENSFEKFQHFFIRKRIVLGTLIALTAYTIVFYYNRRVEYLAFQQNKKVFVQNINKKYAQSILLITPPFQRNFLKTDALEGSKLSTPEKYVSLISNVNYYYNALDNFTQIIDDNTITTNYENLLRKTALTSNIKIISDSTWFEPLKQHLNNYYEYSPNLEIEQTLGNTNVYQVINQ